MKKCATIEHHPLPEPPHAHVVYHGGNGECAKKCTGTPEEHTTQAGTPHDKGVPGTLVPVELQKSVMEVAIQGHAEIAGQSAG